MPKTSKKQNTGVLIAAVCVVALSVFTTLVATGILFGDLGASDEGYQNVTFTDAVLTCKSEVEGDFGKKIRTLVTDNHSSRFDDKQYVYKIFLKMDLYNKKRTSAKSHYVNCFVRAKNGRISKLDVIEEQEAEPGVKRDDGTNMFGMPKRK